MLPTRKKRTRSSTRAAKLDHPSSDWFDQAAAQRAEVFFRTYLRHTKGEWAGQPFSLLPWQRERIIHPIFGSKRADGTRKYRTAYVEVPKKNGKSTIAGGIGLYLLFADDEPGAEIFSAAADRDQAGIVFNTAREMVEAHRTLRRMARVYRRAIEVPKTGSVYRVLSADVPTKHGINAHGIIFDELHAQPNRDLWDVLTTSVGSRRQPLIFAITTAGFDRESICFEQHEYARQWLSGVIEDPSYYAVIAAAGEQDNWQDPIVWALANPSLGKTVSLEYLQDEARRAARMPARQNAFRRYHLNQWVQQHTRWISMELWAENAGPPIDPETLRGRTGYGGLDLASISDLGAWVLVFPNLEDPDEVQVFCRFWCPAARLEDPHNKYRAQYQAWAQAGLIEVVPGDAIDYEIIKKRIIEDGQRFRIVDLAIDRLFQAAQLSMELTRERFEVAGMGMGFLSMAAPMKEFERRLLARKIRHGGHPVLRWMADNVAVKQDAAGNLKPDKASSQGKIDGIVALVMALDRAVRHHGGGGSVYDSRGLRSLEL